MYLLNRVDNETVVPVTEFTFHYVSIKSKKECDPGDPII